MKDNNNVKHIALATIQMLINLIKADDSAYFDGNLHEILRLCSLHVSKHLSSAKVGDLALIEFPRVEDGVYSEDQRSYVSKTISECIITLKPFKLRLANSKKVYENPITIRNDLSRTCNEIAHILDSAYSDLSHNS